MQAFLNDEGDPPEELLEDRMQAYKAKSKCQEPYPNTYPLAPSVP